MTSTTDPGYLRRKEIMAEALDILVVDDNPDILVMMSEILALDGHQVRTFGDGASAITDFQHQPADLVIADIGMPDVTGWQVAQSIRDVSTRTPIIFITAVGERVDEGMVHQLGVSAVLRKPFRISQIRKILREIT